MKIENIQEMLVTDNSVVMRYEILKNNKNYFKKTYSSKKYYHKHSCNENITTNFNEKKVMCQLKSFYLLLTFLSITVILLISVSIYFIIKYWLKQKHLLSYYIANIKFEKSDINNIKMENNKLKEIDAENFKCYYFNDIIKNESFGFDNI